VRTWLANRHSICILLSDHAPILVVLKAEGRIYCVYKNHNHICLQASSFKLQACYSKKTHRITRNRVLRWLRFEACSALPFPMPRQAQRKRSCGPLQITPIIIADLTHASDGYQVTLLKPTSPSKLASPIGTWPHHKATTSLERAEYLQNG
jgi:hypothetical protein